jgi:uncharacterized protein
MELIIVSIAALAASMLTLFSGFGLGTLLMPVIALFFSLELAIAMTAVVHLANNLFKLGLLGRKADLAVVAVFGFPAMVAAFAGAWLLTYLGDRRPWMEYQIGHKTNLITPMKLVVGCMIVVFVIVELIPRFARIEVKRKWLPVGGLISGFFGGLSGHQGAFRSMFLIRSGLGKEAFVATGVVIAVLVDLARLLIYGPAFFAQKEQIEWALVISASLAAFVGAYAGAKLLKKITMQFVQWVVAALLIMVGVGLAGGLL